MNDIRKLAQNFQNEVQPTDTMFTTNIVYMKTEH